MDHNRHRRAGRPVVEGWQLSEPHREIMLDGTYGATGIGIVIEDREFFATALFCR